MTLSTATLTHTCSSDWEQVYEPAEDSFLLIDALETDLKFILEKKPSLCLEVGSGSGVVLTSLAVALGQKSFCVATDINSAACHLTHKTARSNHVDVDVIRADLIPFRMATVDLILFNPPYVPTSSSEISGTGVERSWAGGERGREVVDRFIEIAVPALAPGGICYLLLLAENDPEEVTEVLEKIGCSVKQVTQRRIRGESLFVLRFQKKL